MAAFWALLAAGRDAVTEIPAERFSKAAWLHPRRQEPGKTYSFAAGVLGDVLSFDHAAFGISLREAAEMDPQQRLILELVREACEDGGWREADIAGRALGVYMGASTTDWADLRQFDPAAADRYMMTGGALSVIANRVSNVFDLRGPAQSIDTACSSALVALHHAAEALRLGRIPAALVGGVNMLLSPFPFGGFARASMLTRGWAIMHAKFCLGTNFGAAGSKGASPWASAKRRSCAMHRPASMAISSSASGVRPFTG